MPFELNVRTCHIIVHVAIKIIAATEHSCLLVFGLRLHIVTIAVLGDQIKASDTPFLIRCIGYT